MSTSFPIGGGNGRVVTTGGAQFVGVSNVAASTSGPWNGNPNTYTSHPGLGLISTGNPYPNLGGMDWGGTSQVQCVQHEAGELYEYIDGTIYASCNLCQARIQLTAIPAWGSPKQLEGIVEELMDGSYDEPELALEEILAVEEKLEAAHAEILRAKELIDIARRLALGIASDA